MQWGIINTVLYFDVFEYPLTARELYSHQGKNISYENFVNELEKLVCESLLQCRGGFFLSPLSSLSVIEKRESGNRMAQQMMPVAAKWARRIFRFPFVRSVSLSGSLSKSYFDENSDIDFFIVTKTGRLWICRTLLILYWKMSSAKNKKKLCTNYFIDETVLEMEEQNRFTATELSYLIPIINAADVQKVIANNLWVNNYINNRQLDNSYEISIHGNILKRMCELLFNNDIGQLLENYLLKKTIGRWRTKYPELAAEDFELQFRSRKNVCKRHSKGFQNRVLKTLEEKISEYEKHTGLKLDKAFH